LYLASEVVQRREGFNVIPTHAQRGYLRTSSLLFVGMLALTSAIAESSPGPEARLKEKGITLPEAGKPVGNYVEYVRVGNLLFLAGHGPSPQWRGKGKVGKDVTLEQGYQAAREAGLRLLATTREALGSLDKVKRVVRIFGMVNSAPGFGDQPKVINGCSDLMTEVFGEANGKGTRSAVGMAELPFGIPVEVEMILEVSD
jgi:enamine deaminase RidA (YjgF/YER057c/UK114 family)